MGRVEETTFFCQFPGRKKKQESACYAAAGYRIMLLGCLPGGGGGVLDISLGRGCRPELETLTLFMTKKIVKILKN